MDDSAAGADDDDAAAVLLFLLPFGLPLPRLAGVCSSAATISVNLRTQAELSLVKIIPRFRAQDIQSDKMKRLLTPLSISGSVRFIELVMILFIFTLLLCLARGRRHSAQGRAIQRVESLKSRWEIRTRSDGTGSRRRKKVGGRLQGSALMNKLNAEFRRIRK